MEERYISDIKNTSRSIRFKHTLQGDEVVIDANNHEIVEYEYGILNLYDGTFQDTYGAKDADFQELQNAAKKINRFMPFEKYILNLSKIVGFTCYPEDLMVVLVTKKATHNVEVSNKENYEKLVEFLKSRYNAAIEYEIIDLKDL